MEENIKKETLKLQWERVNDFLDETNITILPKGYLSCAHNTYYALFHAICALNIEYNKRIPRTHKGLLSGIYLNYVKNGILSAEDNKICVKAEDIRSKCDYDGKYKPSIEALTKNYENVKKLIAKIQKICLEHSLSEQNKNTPKIG